MIIQQIRNTSADNQDNQTASAAGLTRVRLVELVSSSGMGRNTARATQLAKMVRRMMTSKGLVETVQENMDKYGGVTITTIKTITIITTIKTTTL